MAKMKDEAIQATLTQAVTDAVDYIDSEISPLRTLAAKYFDGAVNIEAEEGRSKVVATKCRDAVRQITPALLRTFMEAGPGEFEPRTPQAAQQAQEQSAFALLTFERNRGFQALMDVISDALVKKTGVIKCFYEETTEAEYDEYSSMTEEAVLLMLEEEELNIEDIAVEQREDGLYDVSVTRTDPTGEIRFVSVAPEDFFVDRDATCTDDAYVVGHSTEGRVGDLVAMGFDMEEVLKYAGPKTTEEEEQERMAYSTGYETESPTDPSMRKVVITEAYMKMDIEGKGIPRRYKFICVGETYHILDYEPCDYKPFAVFEVDPEPHTFFGRSLVEIVMSDQDTGTALLRAFIDSIYQANTPRVAVNEDMVNLEDVLNNEHGGVIRVTGSPQASLMEFSVGNGAAMTLPAIQYHDGVVAEKTGVSNAAFGAKAFNLHGQTARGVEEISQAYSAQAELIARVLAEGGLRDLFETIVTLAKQHPQIEDMVRINGQYQPIDPRSWTAKTDFKVSIGLGANKREERLSALMATKQDMDAIFQAFGPDNGLVSMTNVRNIREDILRAAGVHAVDRYYQPMDPQIEQMLMQQRQQAAAQQADPNAAFLQVEQMKVQQKDAESQRKIQLETQKAQAKVNADAAKIALENDLKRDDMAQKRALEAARIEGELGLRVNQQAIQAEQNAPRSPDGVIQ